VTGIGQLVHNRCPTGQPLPAQGTSELVLIRWWPLRRNIAPVGFSHPQPSHQDLFHPVPLFQIPIPPMPIHMPGGRVALPTARKSGVPHFHQPPGLRCRLQHFCTPMLLDLAKRKTLLNFSQFPAWPLTPFIPCFPRFCRAEYPKNIRPRNVKILVTSN
jgi:hypothetical protein